MEQLSLFAPVWRPVPHPGLKGGVYPFTVGEVLRCDWLGWFAYVYLMQFKWRTPVWAYNAFVGNGFAGGIYDDDTAATRIEAMAQAIKVIEGVSQLRRKA